MEFFTTIHLVVSGTLSKKNGSWLEMTKEPNDLFAKAHRECPGVEDARMVTPVPGANVEIEVGGVGTARL